MVDTPIKKDFGPLLVTPRWFLVQCRTEMILRKWQFSQKMDATCFFLLQQPFRQYLRLRALNRICFFHQHTTQRMQPSHTVKEQKEQLIQFAKSA